MSTEEELKKEIKILKEQLKLSKELNKAYSIIINHNNSLPIYPYYPYYPYYYQTVTYTGSSSTMAKIVNE